MAHSCVVRYQEHTAVNAFAGIRHKLTMLGYQGRSPWLVGTGFARQNQSAGAHSRQQRRSASAANCDLGAQAKTATVSPVAASRRLPLEWQILKAAAKLAEMRRDLAS